MEKEQLSQNWADSVADVLLERKKKSYVCEGMWTPSGFFHIGNSRPEIFTPYAVKHALELKGAKVQQTFITDDFDAVRKIPQGLGIKKEDESKYLGIPCALAPSPIKGFDSWADAFISDALGGVGEFGVDLKVISAYETYKSGKFNKLITESLDKAQQIVEVWNRVSGADKRLSFLPVQVFCDKCGRIYFTDALSWNGKEVEYKCSNCNHSGRKSPFNANGKLHWRVHWAAHWILHDVDFESAGKDHFSKGGSVDVGHALMKEVFNTQPPYQIPTEFIQLAGRKMAGSVGNVITLRNWLDVAPAEAFRYLNFSYKPNKVIEFDLEGNSFILLLERFERAERIYYGLEEARNEKLTAKIKRDFELSAIEKIPKKMSPQLSYSFAVQLAQLVDFEKDFSKAEEILLQSSHVSGKLSSSDRKRFKEKVSKAKAWVEKHAPAEFKLRFLEKFDRKLISSVDRKALALFPALASSIEKAKNPDEVQNTVFETAKSGNVKPGKLFQALYLVLLGKSHGPKIGTLVFAIGRERCIERIREAA